MLNRFVQQFWDIGTGKPPGTGGIVGTSETTRTDRTAGDSWVRNWGQLNSCDIWKKLEQDWRHGSRGVGATWRADGSTYPYVRCLVHCTECYEFLLALVQCSMEDTYPITGAGNVIISRIFWIFRSNGKNPFDRCRFERAPEHRILPYGRTKSHL